MAAFSPFHYHPFHIDSSVFFSKPDQNLQNLDQSATQFPSLSCNINDDTSSMSHVTNKTSMDSSSIVTDKYESTDQLVTQKNVSTMDKKRKCKEGSVNSAQSQDVKGKKQKKCKEEKKKDEKKATEEAPTGYIHVRARRGQATDSHSLAERVRRERISERMKLLQALVPGCDKVSGKALMLDEIINYVQSLQHQVEFLSMKLASFNPVFYDFGMDLEPVMVRPDESLSNMASPMQTLQQCSPVQPAGNEYSLMDSSVNALLFQPAQLPNILSQDNGQLLWGMDEQRQSFINHPGLSSNLCTFH